MVGNIHLISFLNFFQVAVKRYKAKGLAEIFIVTGLMMVTEVLAWNKILFAITA